MTNYERQLRTWIQDGRLVRIELLKGRGERQWLLGRILNLDMQVKQLIVYQVDEKKVYNLKFNEIENIVET